jgi:hypothetical protein
VKGDSILFWTSQNPSQDVVSRDGRADSALWLQRLLHSASKRGNAVNRETFYGKDVVWIDTLSPFFFKTWVIYISILKAYPNFVPRTPPTRHPLD